MSRTDCGDGTNTFTPEPGEEINCTVTNYGGIPLQIDKDSYGGDGEFEFHLVNSSASFETNVQVVTTGSAGDGTGRGSGTLGLSNIGTYTITENDAPGWEESSNISCTVTHADHTTRVAGPCARCTAVGVVRRSAGVRRSPTDGLTPLTRAGLRSAARP